MKRQRNRVAAWPSRLAVPKLDPDAALNELAMNSGAVDAESQALSTERNLGVAPWHATPSGLVGADYAHVLLRGLRAYNGVLDGAVFYDPNRDEVVLIEPGPDGVLVTIGSLNLIEFLRRGRAWRRCLADLVELAVNAYSDEGPGVVSQWLVRRVRESALLALSKNGHGLSWSGLLPADPDLIWRELGRRWVVQPWGLGTHDELLGSWV